jgi:hypothetical protein
MTWGVHDTLQPLGDRDATIQITVLPRREQRGEEPPTGLLTVRCKDQDLTAEQFEALSIAAAKAARRLRGRARG